MTRPKTLTDWARDWLRARGEVQATVPEGQCPAACQCSAAN